MVKKKKKQVKKKFAVSRREPEKGFFSRFKDVLPEQKKETVRVKTFIVEKPVYVSHPLSRMVPPPQKYNLDAEPVEVMDSRKSRYAKKRREEEILPDEEAGLSDEQSDDYSAEDESFDESAEGEIPEESDSNVDQSLSQTHARSRGMFNNIWWKKALFWAILVWLLILALEMAMQAMKLVEVDLTRQWWILLAGLIVISMVYFKFFSGKIKI